MTRNPDDYIKADPPTYPVGQVCQHGTLARKCDECYADWQLLELCKVIAAQDATIALLRAEVLAWRKLVVSVPVTIENFALRDEINAARAAVDSAHALEGP